MAVQAQRISVEEFDRLVDRPENADKLYEYVGGEIVEVPSNPFSSQIASRINRRLGNFVEPQDMGTITDGQGGYVVAGERYAPDVAFLARHKGPLADRGYNPVPPDLAVEVLSPTDEPRRLRVKLANYLLAGTVVWVVDPETRTVEVYVPGQKPALLDVNGVIDGGEMLPGFRLAVKDLFPE